MTPLERETALEAARWYTSGRVSELSTTSMTLIARLVLELEAAQARPRVLSAVPKQSVVPR
jgi:hypothetical protein